jgi:CRISPR-associated protein Cas4
MEDYLQISNLNDFIFCPRSIYFHNLFGQTSTTLYHRNAQVEGRAAHETIDQSKYSTKKNIVTGIPVYSEKYNICGKIDIYDGLEKILVERKRKIVTIYDGYRYQLYAQFFCMTEMGYVVEKLAFHSLIDNKRFPVQVPGENEIKEFENLLAKIRNFSLNEPFEVNINKCEQCVYSNLCDLSLGGKNA